MFEILLRIKELEDEIKELKKNIPAHSIRPAMMMRVEELEEELDRMRDELTGEDHAPA
jgi:HAMP domain-containing protein